MVSKSTMFGCRSCMPASFFHDGAWYLEDLGSTNGTQLDGEAVVGPTRIKRGARIQITEIEMVLT